MAGVLALPGGRLVRDRVGGGRGSCVAHLISWLTGFIAGRAKKILLLIVRGEIKAKPEENI